MASVAENKIINLKDSVVPQIFELIDDGIYYFDKLNKHEGKFCFYKDGNTEVIGETDGGQGFILSDGKMYILNIGEYTSMYRFNKNNKEKIFETDGIYFDLKINETGHFVCLGNKENITLIKIFNENGDNLGVIQPNILFGSCISLYGDYIFLGGFNFDNTYRIIKMNYIGKILNEWQFSVGENNGFISKILNYGDYILALVTGETDNLIILDTTTGEVKKLVPDVLGLNNFIDFQIFNDEIYILDENRIYVWNFAEIFLAENLKKRYKNKRDSVIDLYAYQYLMCFLTFDECKIYGFISSGIITFFLFIYIIIRKSDLRFIKTIELLIYFYWILSFLISSTINIIQCIDKSKRIEKLLYVKENYNNLNLFFYTFNISFTGYCLMSLLLFPEFNIIYSALTFIVLFTSTSLLNKILIKKIDKTNNNIVIELLQATDEKIEGYIKHIIENLKNTDSEKIMIDISSEDIIKTNVIEAWNVSRKAVIRQEVKYTADANKLTVILDLSKRDNKYSRYSILMDYICFVKNKIKIKEIKISCLEGKGGSYGHQ
ncbi:hypothetical protein Q428_01875 [Fervidicella metallireducens AeB]|uniref:Uncharacterized protein n=1 Tax=Fervidicella metallireducens AeB TaxID=1403537 RepID=A0A017S0A8_9CLOT|nr:hypothetical protein [Fervidicella metallireducens]EYE89595.1 hypothetical protein Q428_01875 [Fervidicella metallireducens AeB]